MRGGWKASLGALLMASPVIGTGLMVLGSSGPASAGACQSDWPMFQHDELHSAAACGGIDQSSVSRLTPQWYFPTTSDITAEPAVVGGVVYVGDADGNFYAINQHGPNPGQAKWTFNVTTGDSNCAADKHSPSYGEIVSSATVVGSKVYLGGGGTLYALNIADGSCAWSQNVDPANPTSPMEVESSPVYDSATNSVIVGSDVNEASGSSIGKPGVQAFDATTGLLDWKFEVEDVSTITGPGRGGSGNLNSSGTDGCGDVWGSPALDPSANGGTGLVVFGTGNCNNASDQLSNNPQGLNVSGIWAIDATSGSLAWKTAEPDNAYNNTTSAGSADDDFGTSPIIAHLANGNHLVIVGGKSGYAYGIRENADGLLKPGTVVWKTQAAQPGNYGQGPGAIGGFIGSAALGTANGSPTVFLTSAIYGPFTGDGIQPQAQPCDSVPGGQAPVACPDANLASNSDRLASVHAIDATTGAVVWQQRISTPTYGPVTFSSDADGSNGVVFAPSTTSFAEAAYNADNGTPLWVMPNGAADSSGVAISGLDVTFGAGTQEGSTNQVTSNFSSSIPGVGLPPEAYGVWDVAVAQLPQQ